METVFFQLSSSPHYLLIYLRTEAGIPIHSSLTTTSRHLHENDFLLRPPAGHASSPQADVFFRCLRGLCGAVAFRTLNRHGHSVLMWSSVQLLTRAPTNPTWSTSSRLAGRNYIRDHVTNGRTPGGTPQTLIRPEQALALRG
jgi:hypothetical protein